MRCAGAISRKSFTYNLFGRYPHYSNIIFTVIFATEMMLKLLGDGCYAYVNDGFSVFDGIVVAVR